MYFAGIGLTIIYCIILKKTRAFAGEPAPFVMELPQYHIPSVKGCGYTYGREYGHSSRRPNNPLPLLCSYVVPFMLRIQDGAFGLVDTENSLLAVIGSAIAVILCTTWIRYMAGSCIITLRLCGKRGYRFNNGGTLRTWRGRRVCSKHA